jgi:hypothetical protein
MAFLPQTTTTTEMPSTGVSSPETPSPGVPSPEMPSPGMPSLGGPGDLRAATNALFASAPKSKAQLSEDLEAAKKKNDLASKVWEPFSRKSDDLLSNFEEARDASNKNRTDNALMQKMMAADKKYNDYTNTPEYKNARDTYDKTDAEVKRIRAERDAATSGGKSRRKKGSKTVKRIQSRKNKKRSKK